MGTIRNDDAIWRHETKFIDLQGKNMPVHARWRAWGIWAGLMPFLFVASTVFQIGIVIRIIYCALIAVGITLAVLEYLDGDRTIAGFGGTAIAEARSRRRRRTHASTNRATITSTPLRHRRANRA